jgi:uncharacterized membrane protein HdeD (DUF308 family)
MAAKTLAAIGWHASCVVVGAAPHEVANNARLHLGNWSMSDLTRRYRRKLSVHIATPEDLWKLFLLQGGGLILLGLFAAIIPNVTELPIGALIGWFLLIAGLFRLGSGFGAEVGPGHWSSMLLSALMVLLGATLALHSNASDFELSRALAGYFVLHAVASLILASSLRHQGSSWLAVIFGAVVDVLLAAAAIAQWPSTLGWVFALYLGLNLIVAGAALTVVGLGDKFGQAPTADREPSRQPYDRPQ